MRIAIGCDHRGLDLKNAIARLLAGEGHTCQDSGCHDSGSVDYPDFAADVARAVAEGRSDFGILICNTGIGMSISANKVPGAYAALCHDVTSAQRSRQHNNANVLCLGASVVGPDTAADIVRAYLSADFKGGRHLRRLEKVKALEQAPFP
ncbi:MAG: ribose 5-phosphate isomerase B [Chloroflexota bacterium]